MVDQSHLANHVARVEGFEHEIAIEYLQFAALDDIHLGGFVALGDRRALGLRRRVSVPFTEQGEEFGLIVHAACLLRGATRVRQLKSRFIQEPRRPRLQADDDVFVTPLAGAAPFRSAELNKCR